jgi:hypothetical protein
MELNEQTLKEILTEQREEYQRYQTEQREEYQRHVDAVMTETRHVGVLVEGLRSDVKGIAEGHATLRQEMAEGFREVNVDMEQMRLEMELMRSELSIIRSDLKQKVGRDELAVLEARVAKLEQTVRAR